MLIQGKYITKYGKMITNCLLPWASSYCNHQVNHFSYKKIYLPDDCVSMKLRVVNCTVLWDVGDGI